MQTCNISFLIPARSEIWLKKTIEDLIAHCESNIEIIVVLDGAWAEPSIPQHPLVNVIYLPESIGQRLATNMACRLARGKYIIKVDAHCSFQQGFDRILLEGFKEVGDETLMIPVMRNLWAFDHKCMSCGLRTYQGPTIKKCKVCGGTDIRKKTVWVAKDNLTKSESHGKGKGPRSTSYCFDSTPHFQYFNEWTKTETYKEQLKTGYTETMNIQGSFFMCTRDNYWKLLADDFGSWGNQAIQCACAFWLTDRKVIVNHNTWYAHLFRTQGGDFSFPYKQNETEIQKTKKKVRDWVYNNKIPGQVHKLEWLVERFSPVKGWSSEDLQKLKSGLL